MAQRDRIVLKLREMIASGELAPGQRVVEIPVAERLGVSRTPVRQALGILAKEGLLAGAGKRGYVVRSFTLKDIIDAIELRGALEGMAARLVAEAGMTEALAADLEACLAEGEAIAQARQFGGRDDARWADMNDRFHRLIVTASANRALIDALALNDLLPFASAKSVLGGDAEQPALVRKHHEILQHAQFQHRAVMDALRRGEGARAEALMREHALAARDNVIVFRAAIPPLGRGPRPVETTEAPTLIV